MFPGCKFFRIKKRKGAFFRRQLGGSEIGMALYGLASFRPQPLPGWSGRILIIAVVLTSLFFQGGQRWQSARAGTVEDYIEATSVALPPNSLAIAAWREFTVLTYYQQLHEFRPDVDFIVGARTARNYSHGRVEDYMELVAEEICDRPVVTNKLRNELGKLYEQSPLADDQYWYRLKPRDSTSGDVGC